MIGKFLSTLKFISQNIQDTVRHTELADQFYVMIQEACSNSTSFTRKNARNVIGRVLENTSYSDPERFAFIISILDLLEARERSEVFFEFIDNRLQDTDLYWQLFKYVLCHSNASKRHRKHITDSLRRHGRLNGTARERIESSIVDGADEVEQALALYDSLAEEVLLYRGFIVSGGNRVRRSAKKSSPLYYRQAEGSGFSYTIDEDMAAMFAARAAHNYACNLQRMQSKRTTQLSSFKQCFEHFYRGGHPYVGTYLVPKEKIVLVVTETKEKEIIVQPEDAHLVSYKVLHAEDIYEKFVKMYPRSFPIPSNVNWEPVEFQEVMRQWAKPHMY